MASTVRFRNQYFPQFDSGKPISNAQIYIGEIDLDPEIVANQKPITFLQEDGSEVAGSQPVRTSGGGVPIYNGSPVTVLVDGDYSIKILNSLGSQIYYTPQNSDDLQGQAVIPVASIAEIESANYSVGAILSLNSGGRSGVFDVVAGDFSAEVAADTQHGVYVALSGDPGATTKVARRRYSYEVNVLWFGAQRDNTTDDYDAFRAAIDFAGSGFQPISIIIPKGEYKIGSTLEINKPIAMRGEGVGIAAVGVVDGVYLNFPGDEIGMKVVAGGNYAILENFVVKADDNSLGWASGFVMQRRCEMRFVSVRDWSGHGITIDSSTAGGGGNSNLFRLEYCEARDNGGHGLFIEGADSNAGTNIGFNGINNGGYAIYDSSFLGNHHYGCHQAGGGGAFAQDSNNSSGTFIGCYSENKNWHIENDIVIGGSNSNRNLNGSQADNRRFFVDPNPTGVGYLERDELGSGYTSAPTVTIDPPSGAETATATATVKDGEITFITLSDGIDGSGAGYGEVPDVTITDSTGTGATAKAFIGTPIYNNDNFFGRVVFVQVTNPGSGYSNNPTITIDPPEERQATATANLLADGRVISYNVTDKGTGYTTTPTVSVTGGGGSGASAGAVLSRGLRRSVELSANNETILQFANDVSERTVQLQYDEQGSDDISLNASASGDEEYMLLTGSKTAQTFGRAEVQRYKTQFRNGIVLTNRTHEMSSTIPPSSGEYARGDVIYQINPSAGGAPGVVCTTSGTAGSTAVFKNMAALDS